MALIRKALPHDAKALSQLAEKTFRDTYGAVNTPENMALHCRMRYGDAIQAEEIRNAATLVLLCEDGGELQAYAQLRWGEPPNGVPGTRPGKIQRLYVDALWHGKGLAQLLMQACLDALREQGSDVVWLGVWEHNLRAIAFYKKSGFEEVGEHVFFCWLRICSTILSWRGRLSNKR